MGVDTKGKIKKEYTVRDVQRALKHKFNIETKIIPTSFENYYNVQFKYKDEDRILSLFENYADDETREVGTHMSLRAWGSSVEIMKGIIEIFGGFIIENDSLDEWEYVSPNDKINLSEEEILEDKLHSKLAGEKMNQSEKIKIIDYVKANLEFIKSL